MTNRFDILLHPDDVRWAAAEGVSEDVIAAVLLLHERSVDEIVPELSAAELEQVIKLVGRSPRVYPPGTLEALKSKRNASPTPMAESRAKKQTPSTARADHPLREQTRACRGFGTAAQQSTIEHASGAAASQNTAAVTDQPAAPIKPDGEQMRMAHERRLAMLRAHTPQSDTEPERAITAKKPGTRPGTRTETDRRRYEVAQLMKMGLSVRTISHGHRHTAHLGAQGHARRRESRSKAGSRRAPNNRQAAGQNSAPQD